MFVSVVILTWNDGPLLHEAVESALASVGVEVEVIVVDNGSDPPAEVVLDPRVRIVRVEENLGVARGRNLGVSMSTGDAICLLDSDASLPPTSLVRLCEGLLSADDIGLVAPVFTDQSPEASAGRAPTLLRKAARIIGLTSDYAPVVSAGGRREVDFAIGACQVFRRTAYEEVGGIEERWFYGPEDTDFCLRMKLAGWRIIQLDVPCDHPPRRRNRNPISRRGLRHARTVIEFHWRHRAFQRRFRRVDRARG